MRQSPSRNRPAIKPNAATTRQGCGPESPIAMGRGGSRIAAQRNASSQRFGGPMEIHQHRQISTAGTSIAAAEAGVRASAISAAYTPRAIDPHSQRGLVSASIMPARDPDGTAVQLSPLRRVTQLQRDAEGGEN